MLGVSVPTIVNWVEGGRLEAHKTPGGHRRIAKEALQRFSVGHDYPLPAALRREVGPRRVLVVDAEPDYVELLVDLLGLADAGWEVRGAETPFLAGLELGRFRPDVVVLDLGLPGLDAERLAATIAEDPDLGAPKLVGLMAVPSARLEARALDAGFVEVRSKAGDMDALIQRLGEIAPAG
jgi:excisionase family DNA binding protein